MALQAELADRDFTAQRGQGVVLSAGEQQQPDSQQSAAERRAAELRNQHRCVHSMSMHVCKACSHMDDDHHINAMVKCS